MSILPGMFPAGVIGNAAATVTYQTSVADTTSQTTYTFSSVAIGAAAANRTVIVGIVTRDPVSNAAMTTDSVTIGGLSATKLAERTNAVPATSLNAMTFWGALVPTGTTADIVATNSRSGAQRMGIMVWSSENLENLSAYATGASDSVTSLSMDTNTIRDGITIGMGFANGNPDLNWTGLTEDNEFVVETDLEMSGASLAISASETLRTITCAIVSGSNVGIGLVVSLR